MFENYQTIEEVKQNMVKRQGDHDEKTWIWTYAYAVSG